MIRSGEEMRSIDRPAAQGLHQTYFLESMKGQRQGLNRAPRQRGGKAREETLEIRSLNNARGARARKGKAADLGFKPETIVRVE